ncbi:MAG: hypothetical protein AB1445_06250 [Bacillota bacterium]
MRVYVLPVGNWLKGLGLLARIVFLLVLIGLALPRLTTLLASLVRR